MTFLSGFIAGFLSISFIMWLKDCVRPMRTVTYWCHCGYWFKGAKRKRALMCPRCGETMFEA